jgi:exonuclease SbcC
MLSVQKQVISGGEEDVVALALRMALSELIQERQGRPMSLMILDEVFGSLDVERRQAVLERLHSIKGRFAQILVISHIEEINQVADQCIFLTRDDNTRSTVIGDLPLETGQLVLSS